MKITHIAIVMVTLAVQIAVIVLAVRFLPLWALVILAAAIIVGIGWFLRRGTTPEEHSHGVRTVR